jgi:hypothetical protein
MLHLDDDQQLQYGAPQHMQYQQTSQPAQFIELQQQLGSAGTPAIGLQLTSGPWVKYYIQRVSTNVNHVLFYVVDPEGMAKLAVVVTCGWDEVANLELVEHICMPAAALMRHRQGRRICSAGSGGAVAACLQTPAFNRQLLAMCLPLCITAWMVCGQLEAPKSDPRSQLIAAGSYVIPVLILPAV